jgi:hypothetical protein
MNVTELLCFPRAIVIIFVNITPCSVSEDQKQVCGSNIVTKYDNTYTTLSLFLRSMFLLYVEIFHGTCSPVTDEVIV